MSRNEANSQQPNSKTMTFAHIEGVKGRFNERNNEELTLRDNEFYSMTY